MYRLLIKNRLTALIVIAIALFSLRLLVGTSGEEGAIDGAAAQIGDVAAERAAEEADMPAAQEAPIIGFVPDDDLIDDAMGFDPAPTLDMPE